MFTCVYESACKLLFWSTYECRERPEGDVRSPGASVTGSLSCMMWVLGTISTAEPSHQPVELILCLLSKFYGWSICIQLCSEILNYMFNFLKYYQVIGPFLPEWLWSFVLWFMWWYFYCHAFLQNIFFITILMTVISVMVSHLFSLVLMWVV